MKERIIMLVGDAYGGRGGIAAYNRALAEALSSDPNVSEVVIVPRLRFGTDYSLPKKVTVDESALGSIANYAIACSRHAFARDPVGIIHCGHINLAPFAALLARMKCAPWCLSIHGIEAWKRHPRWSVRRALPRATRFLSVTSLTSDRFKAWLSAEKPQIEILPGPIHIDSFEQRPRRSDLVTRYNLDSRTVLMSFGRLAGYTRAKGFDEVLEAIPTLMRTIPNVVYLICGDGPDRPRLEKKAHDLGIANYVRFAGFIDESEKIDVYQLADVFVMPSSGEGLGFVLLEARACGIPVIGSKTDGTREALLNGELGRLVTPGDIDELVAAVMLALREPRGIPPALDHFSYDNFKSRVHTAFAGLSPATWSS